MSARRQRSRPYPPNSSPGRPAIVTGASRGFGRGIATALVKAGVRVVGVAHAIDALGELRVELGGGFIPVVAEAADPPPPAGRSAPTGRALWSSTRV
jgi:NAD(P)-dependent dehydrogenase (short-subunit alcohol dehydrogenase family)